jgi:hypothetical protein
MRQPSPEDEVRRTLRFMIFAFIVGIILAAALAYWVPFDVDLVARFEQSDGIVYFVDGTGNEHRLDEVETLPIQVGEAVRLEVGNTARVEIFEGSNAYAYLTGPVEWQYTLADRRGTAVDHVLDDARDFEVMIDQISGAVVYDFSGAAFPLEAFNLVLRFSDGEVMPEANCFQATAPTEASASAVVEIPCAGDDPTQSPQPTLPPLP